MARNPEIKQKSWNKTMGNLPAILNYPPLFKEKLKFCLPLLPKFTELVPDFEDIIKVYLLKNISTYHYINNLFLRKFLKNKEKE